MTTQFALFQIRMPLGRGAIASASERDSLAITKRRQRRASRAPTSNRMLTEQEATREGA